MFYHFLLLFGKRAGKRWSRRGLGLGWTDILFRRDSIISGAKQGFYFSLSFFSLVSFRYSRLLGGHSLSYLEELLRSLITGVTLSTS